LAPAAYLLKVLSFKTFSRSRNFLCIYLTR
jgi:hypothetical protein